ncbi:hypothetical protein BC669P3_00018 [Bacteroides phage BC669P3]|nr:hypothetical protein BC669P3_00018 [Bacteroides phage BC669P3]
MIKKYEIINDGGKKRIKALRPFHVQGRYVNIGDVGGIVYDENTLSQEGNGWIFSGNLNYPSIRVSGDSIVDTNGYEADVTDPRPFVNITGASTLIGAHDFVTGSTAGGEPIEAYLDINDSRLEFRYTSAMTVATKVNPANTTLVGVYKSVIDTSNVIISKTGNGAFTANIFAEVIKCNVRFNAVTKNSLLIGNFSNVSEIINDGSYSFAASNAAKNGINVRDCYTFAQSETVLPTSALGAAPANTPFTFIRCNVPNGIFYHNAKVKNIYTDIDFAKASADLGKTITGTVYKLVSSEVEGMYRIYDTTGNAYGYLVEAHDSVAGLTSMGANSYNTTIYKDAYIRGKFDFAGTNVFGNKVPGHPRAQVLNVQPRAAQGDFDTVSRGQTITKANGVATVVCVLEAFRISGSKGILVSGARAGIEVSVVFVSANNTIISASGWTTTPWTPSPVALAYEAAYLRFRKAGDSPITPEDLAGVTVTVYNGCKIVNTGETAVPMKGNIRVEDNATLVNASVVGTGYFGGNSVTENANVQGCMYIKDNAIFAPVAEAGKSDNQIYLEGNARFLAAARAEVNVIKMSGNSVFSGTKASPTIVIDLRDNAEIQSRVSGSGTLVMKDDARVEAGTLSATGEITLCGRYKQTAPRSGFFGKRTIADVNAPDYDDNVKTEYDF